VPDLLKIEVLVRCDPKDGNDPLEAVTYLPCVPVKGQKLCVWVDEGGGGIYGSREEYLDIEDVVLTTYAPERIEVWVTPDTYDLDEIRRIITAIQNNEQP
jgi:hypothetical protein